MRKLDIGTVSYRNPARLQKMIETLRSNSSTDFTFHIIHNPSLDPAHEEELTNIYQREIDQGRVKVERMSTNQGYAHGVNVFLGMAQTEYVLYVDNDTEILTPGWDEQLAHYLDRYHEIGMIFPNHGVYPINRGPYVEVMWGVGFCFMLNRMAQTETGFMDEKIGHQEDPDYCLRLRMAGWKCAAASEVKVNHHATATNDPAASERISRGVKNFVDKWNRYFNGVNFNYHSTNVTRWEDWPPNALYLEEYHKTKLPNLNDNPERVEIDGRPYDLIKVPRFADFYKGRII